MSGTGWMTWLRRQLREYGKGARILATRRFWADVRWYWLTRDGGLPRAMDERAARLAENLGGKPYQRRYPPGGPDSWPRPSSKHDQDPA